MAKISKRNLDAAKRAPIRKKSYEAPSLNRKRSVPKEYQSFNKAPKSKGGCLWFLFLIFLATLAGFWYWNKQSNPEPERSAQFSVEGPKEIVSGDQAVYIVKYKNIDVVPLQKMELNVRWPSGFYFDEASVEPHDLNATTWFLDDLQPGQTKEVQIKGQLVGQKDEVLSASFTLGYQPENFHSDFKEREVIDTTIKENKIEMAIEGPDKILVADPVQFRLLFKNLTDEKIENLYTDVLFPDDWAPVVLEQTEEEKEDNPAAEAVNSDFVQENKYYVFSLEPGEEKIMYLDGNFPVDSLTNQLLVIEVGNMADNNFRRLSRVEKQITVVNPKFDISLQVNGKYGTQAVNWDDTLKYQLEITNQSEADISDVQILALIDTPLLSWDTLDSVGNYEEGKIIWTKDEDESLSSWPTGETKTFTWQVKITGEPQVDRTIENIVKINIQGLSDWEQVTSPLLLTVGESLRFNNGIYWDLGGRRVGSGVLPPQVGEDTQYLVIWSLPEATGQFDDVTVETTLPPEVNFISETDIQAGDLEFDLEGRTLTWNIANFNEYILPLTASFLIQITPISESQGQAATLLNPTTVQAKGLEEVMVRSKLLKTSDVIADTTDAIGIVQ
ncbi:hypothetical protein KKH39_00015 [Patescibacteria group bacterium]|nr:hypothetical protein [Patescibacteria group bacterium]